MSSESEDSLELPGDKSTGVTAENSCQENKTLSKNQLKKLKKKEKWLHIKAEKRKEEKLKRKRKLAEMKERGEDIGPSRKSLKKRRMVDSSCKLQVAIDCSFDEYMTEKDTAFLAQQIQFCYAANRRAENPLQLYVCGIDGKAKKRLDSIGDYKGWDLYKEERDYSEVFPKEKIVYLSSESPNVLGTLDDSKVYIIGGLVDHNHHKGLCHQLAEEKGLAHAQLPLGQFLQLKSRKVLTINHVFEILLRFTETKDWQTSFLSVLPQRKGIKVKEDSAPGNPLDSASPSADVAAVEVKNSGDTIEGSESESQTAVKDLGDTLEDSESQRAVKVKDDPGDIREESESNTGDAAAVSSSDNESKDV